MLDLCFGFLFWIFVFGWIWIFVLFHTGPHVGAHPNIEPSGITYMNTIIIRASTFNNIISFHLYVYNDKLFPRHQSSPPHNL